MKELFYGKKIIVMNEFNLDKKYRFNMDIALKDEHLKKNYESGNAKYWVDYCNGKEVVVTGVVDGKIVAPIKDYEIAPWWCEEIE